MTPQVTPQVISLLEAFSGEHDRDELMDKIGLKDRKNFREIYLNTAVMMGLIEMTIPGKPTRSKQKYRLTEKGRSLLKST